MLLPSSPPEPPAMHAATMRTRFAVTTGVTGGICGADGGGTDTRKRLSGALYIGGGAGREGGWEGGRECEGGREGGRERKERRERKEGRRVGGGGGERAAEGRGC
jgi:hypothetical protein